MLTIRLRVHYRGCKIYIVEQGDYVEFRSKQPKDIIRYSPVHYNIPLCLYGLHTDGLPIDRGHSFRVQYLSNTGFILAIDEFPSGLYFMKNRLQWSSSPIVSESVVNKLSNLV